MSRFSAMDACSEACGYCGACTPGPGRSHGEGWPRPCSFCGELIHIPPPVPSTHQMCARCQAERAADVKAMAKADAFTRGAKKGTAA